MSNFKCVSCGMAIIEGTGGHYVTGCKHYPMDTLKHISPDAPASVLREHGLCRIGECEELCNKLLELMNRNALIQEDSDYICDLLERVSNDPQTVLSEHLRSQIDDATKP